LVILAGRLFGNDHSRPVICRPVCRASLKATSQTPTGHPKPNISEIDYQVVSKWLINYQFDDYQFDRHNSGDASCAAVLRQRRGT
jgi:hypothetical protein